MFELLEDCWLLCVVLGYFVILRDVFGLIVTNIMVYCLNCLNDWLFICIVNSVGVSIVVVVRVVCVWFVFSACLY